MIISAVPFTVNADDKAYFTENEIKEAAALLREAVIGREESVTINMRISESATEGFFDIDDYILSELYWEIIFEIEEHTGLPKEGDNIYYQYDGCVLVSHSEKSEGYYDVELVFWIYNYTTPEEEEELDEAVEKCIDDLDLQGKSDYEKTAAIYSYICENVAFDFSNAMEFEKYRNSEENEFDEISMTAYAALVKGKAISYGFANLLYRLFCECEIDSRIALCYDEEDNIIAVNIVKLGDYYYYLDAAKDSLSKNQTTYFLKGESDFINHKTVEGFYDEEIYPIAETGYPEEEPEKIVTYGDCDGNGKVDLNDVVLLSKYLANYDYESKMSSVEISEGADANADGSINLNDLILLRRYLANYDYQTGTSTVILGK